MVQLDRTAHKESVISIESTITGQEKTESKKNSTIELSLDPPTDINKTANTVEPTTLVKVPKDVDKISAAFLDKILATLMMRDQGGKRQNSDAEPLVAQV